MYLLVLYVKVSIRKTDGAHEDVAMNKEEFSKILKERGYADRQIEFLWDARPDVDIDEQRLRETVAHFAHTKDDYIQK